MVKQGYKQTEIGVLPESWDTITFEDCFSILPNNTLSRAVLNYNGGEVRNIHYGDILVKHPAVLDCSVEGLPYINKENAVKASKGFLRDGDLIMADTAEDVIVGKSTEVIHIGGKVVSGLHTIPCRPKDAEMFVPKWLGYFINHCTYHDQLIPYITGIKVSSVSKSAISGTVIAVPPRSEQKAIVEALSDIDTLIANLEKLIAKKKAIKQGAMQELLTGKRRLPGFDGEWITISLKNASCDVLNGDRSDRYPSGDDFKDFGVPFINAGHLKNNKVAFENMDYIAPEHFDLLSGVKLQQGDLLFCLRGSLGKFAIVDFDTGAPASSLCAIRCRGNLLSSYLFHLLASDIFKRLISNANTGSSQPNLSAEGVEKFEVTIPENKDEQLAIANVLSDLSAEIESLEEKLIKYLRMKQGMMSELLTGRIRLI